MPLAEYAHGILHDSAGVNLVPEFLLEGFVSPILWVSPYEIGVENPGNA